MVARKKSWKDDVVVPLNVGALAAGAEQFDAADITGVCDSTECVERKSWMTCASPVTGGGEGKCLVCLHEARVPLCPRGLSAP
jgi:hypothetical protein